MAILMHIRRSADWNSMTTDGLDPSVTNVTKLRNAINIWDDLFALTYFQYRARLKEIASDSWNHYEIIQNPLAISKNDWLVPTDDDDWVSPYLELPDNAEFVHWKPVMYKTISPAIKYIKESNNGRPESNSYAIRGSLIKRLPVKVRQKVICEHQKSLKLAAIYTTPKFLDKTMSIYNVHPGCAHMLKSSKTPQSVRLLFPIGVPSLSKSESWATPYAEQLADLYNLILGSIE